MTREEAIKEFYEILELGAVDYQKGGLITRIYNDFESRTCDNCIHISTKCDIFKNNYKYILETRGLEISKYKFTCGLWESKNGNML